MYGYEQAEDELPWEDNISMADWEGHYYVPPYVESVETMGPRALRQAIEYTIQFWIDCRYDAHVYAAYGTETTTPLEAYKSTLGNTASWTSQRRFPKGWTGNNYYQFDWHDLILQAYATRMCRDYRILRCLECGSMWNQPDGHDCDAAEDGEYDTEEATPEEYYDYLTEFYVEADQLPDDVREVDAYEGYKLSHTLYRQSLDPIHDQYRPAMDECLQDLRSPDRHTVAAAMLRALHLAHHHGQVLHDYGETCGLEDGMINKLNSGGLTAVYSEAEIQAWLDGTDDDEWEGAVF